jgi:prolyl 4-hydroxylase
MSEQAEVDNWVINAVERGRSPEQILTQMQESGWSEAQALEAIERALRQRVSLIVGSAPRATAATVQKKPKALPPAVPVPEPDLSHSPSSLIALGREVGIRVVMQQPRVIVFDSLLSQEECQAVISEARDRLQASRVVGEKFGEHDLHPARVSDGMFFKRKESPLVTAIEERIAALIHWPLDHGEAIQVLRYGVGGKYDPHYDYFRLERPATEEATKTAGNRVATLIMYLNTPKRGGGTLFPSVGLEVKARQGDAVFFSYERPDPSTKTLHGGMPVLEGEKWIATKWLRERRFK